MKKLVTLLLAAGMVFSAANGASAVEMKVSGSWLTSFTFADNLFNDNYLIEDAGSDGSFNAAQRIRINFDMVASESLSGRVQLEAANGGDKVKYPGQYHTWGTSSTGGTGKAVTARLAYLDWMIPTTDVLVRMGRQVVSMPSYTFSGSMLGDTGTVDGVVVNAPINEMVGVTVGWLRPSAELNRWGAPHYAHTSVDLAFLSVDLAGDGFKISPWGMIGLHGNGSYDDDGNLVSPGSLDMMGFGSSSDARTTVYWAGLGGELSMFDPFRFTADFLYSGNDADGTARREGWYAALGTEMKTRFATPFLRGWYASGDDADSRKSGRMLNVGAGGEFDASAIYFHANGMLATTIDKKNPAGTWGIQAGVKNVSFVEDLTHRLSLTYIQGTNNTNRITDGTVSKPSSMSPVDYMTTADSAWEIDFLSSYKLYQNLTANLLLAYLITDYDESIRSEKFDNAFRSTLNFTYAF